MSTPIQPIAMLTMNNILRDIAQGSLTLLLPIKTSTNNDTNDTDRMVSLIAGLSNRGLVTKSIDIPSRTLDVIFGFTVQSFQMTALCMDDQKQCYAVLASKGHQYQRPESLQLPAWVNTTQNMSFV
ncbi:hypothetical protein [Vibrio halioticoli]|nr:hypothetical protein [Vibrio halioticoli]